ncbi:hypothetical protein RclHR1_04120005 [Rhizophagus clarus]|uniref:Zn(2)-C6 fungal-type domain-containing protein n=1 Tax=Rhizophagus clarus TaxID=94130 RepID=A0A2Z6RSR0_9GLOM|nr:hypothetical protein RclHR1_04120005 [Rhizophagus clarus]GES74967.1 hypothetical protein GLOIN_2v1644959 [Rhizophagus clarus]
MSQEKRVIEELSNKEHSNNSSSDNKQAQPNNKVISAKKTAKKRGRINVNACYRCRRDKKKCDGNYSTKESCKYCRHHKVECSYPEPGRKRMKIAQPQVEDISKIKVKETKKLKKSAIKKDPIKDINDRIIRVEENLSDVTELLTNNVPYYPNIKEITKQLFFRLFFDESTTMEQMLLLRKLWSFIEKIMNYSTNNDEFLYAFYGRIQFLESDQEEVRSLMWNEIQSFVDRCNDSGKPCDNESSIHSLTPTLSSEVTPLYDTSSLHLTKSLSPILPEFDNNNDYLEEISLENLCNSINNPFIAQETYDNKLKTSPIVPSQRIPRTQLRKQGETSQSASPNEFTWSRNDDSIAFNNHFISNSMPYIDSSSSHNGTPIIDDEMDYLRQLTNEGTNFLHFHSTTSSPLFPNENCTTPTFNSLQPSPSHHPLNEIDHSYGILSPISDYTQQQIDEKNWFGIIEQ